MMSVHRLRTFMKILTLVSFMMHHMYELMGNEVLS